MTLVKTAELPLFDEILVNPSVPEEDELRLSVQALKIWGIFRRGLPVSTIDLMHIAGQYQARLYEVRRALIPYGLCIDLVKKGNDGVNYYSLVELEQSSFFAKRKETLCY